MNISRSQLIQMKNVNLVQYVQSAIDITTPLVASLEDYNVTATMVAAWQTLCTQFSTANSSPKNAIANREAINKDIYALLRDCMVMITNQCDEIAYQFSQSPSTVTFYNTYLANRKLNPQHVSTQLRAYCEDELSQPMQAQVFIDGTDISAYSDPKTGYCLISGIPFGEHTVTVVTGENSKTFGPYDFKKGQSITKHFTVAPAFAPAAKSTTSNQKTLAR
jgi:hypothetical protein